MVVLGEIPLALLVGVMGVADLVGGEAVESTALRGYVGCYFFIPAAIGKL